MDARSAQGGQGEDQGRTRLFVQHRPRLRGIAYRMLGSLGDAEDIVQEAFPRWHEADAATIRSAEAWLVATTTRLSIDRLRPAGYRRRRVRYDCVRIRVAEPARAEK